MATTVRSEAVLGGVYSTAGEYGATHRGRLPVTTARNREIDRMALAHACIVVLPHPLPPRGETGERRMTTTRRRRRGCSGAARGGECEQETEEEEDAGGRVVDVAGAKVMGISFSRAFAGSVYTSSSPAYTPASFFSGNRVPPSLVSLFDPLRGSRSVHPSRRCITIVRAKSASF